MRRSWTQNTVYAETTVLPTTYTNFILQSWNWKCYQFLWCRIRKISYFAKCLKLWTLNPTTMKNIKGGGEDVYYIEKKNLEFICKCINYRKEYAVSTWFSGIESTDLLNAEKERRTLNTKSSKLKQNQSCLKFKIGRYPFVQLLLWPPWKMIRLQNGIAH